MDKPTNPAILSVIYRRQIHLDCTCIVCVKDTIIVFMGISHSHIYIWIRTLDNVLKHDNCINVPSLQTFMSYL
jgi:hypothetical protein